MNQTYNPIQSVDNVQIRCPSAYTYNLVDVSASDAGRTEDTVMHKKLLGQLVKLELEWQNISTADCAALLQAFNPEYISVRFLDAKTGSFRTSTFYTGDRKAPSYNTLLGVWTLSFNIIERTAV